MRKEVRSLPVVQAVGDLAQADVSSSRSSSHDQLGINNAQIGLISDVDGIIQCVCTYLESCWHDDEVQKLTRLLLCRFPSRSSQLQIWPIIGGTLLDHYGVDIVSLLCTGCVLLGCIISALGPQLVNWRLLVGGQLIMVRLVSLGSPLLLSRCPSLTCREL
jgi:hypothetical protein